MDSAGAIPGNTANHCGYETECLATEPVRGVCPHGWHLPSNEEWTALVVALDENLTEYNAHNVAAKALKSKDVDKSATDIYSFAMLPSGYMWKDGNFEKKDYEAWFWGSSANNETWPPTANVVRWDYRYDSLSKTFWYRQVAGSVRCLKDKTTTTP